MARLSEIQTDVLSAWFSLSKAFFLTGDAALIAFHHVARQTDDLDLFTVDALTFQDGPTLVESVCRQIGAQAEPLRTGLSFRRYRISRSEESTILDLVHDAAPQLHIEKSDMGEGILADSADEILVNKLCALVGRAEPRDFFDVWALAHQGLDVDEALNLAAVKDGGVTAESLVFVLQGLKWAAFQVPGLEADERGQLVQFFQTWCERLAMEMFPGGH